MILYWVDPADTSNWIGPLSPGDKDPVSGVTLQGPDPANDIYEGIEAFCGRSFSTNIELTGPVQDPTTMAQQVCVVLPIETLSDQKLTDLDGYAQFVRVQSVRSTASSNFWISLSSDQRDFISSANDFLQDRLKDRTLGTDSAAPTPVILDPATYWARDIPILLIRDSNGARIVANVDEPGWGQVMKDIGLYDLARRDAAVNVINAIDAAVDAGDSTALIAIDVADPVYGWPAYYTGLVTAGIRVARNR